MGFVLQKYGKFQGVSLEHLVEDKPLISEEGHFVKGMLSFYKHIF